MNFLAAATTIASKSSFETVPEHAEQAGESGLTLLHVAALHNRVDVAMKLISFGAKVGSKTTSMLMNAPDKRFIRAGSATFRGRDSNDLIPSGGCFDKGSTPLHLAASVGDIEMVRLLLDNKGKPNLLNGAGATSLHLGALSRNPSLVQLLLAGKPKLHAKTKLRKSASFYDAGMTAMLCALEAGDTEVADLLADAGCVYTDVSNGGYDAIYFAARGGNVELIRRALAAMEHADRSYSNDEPLLNAITAQSVEGVATLISSTLFDRTGRAAPLYLATRLNQLDIRQQLLNAGVSPLNHSSAADAARTNDTTFLRAFEGDLDAVVDGRTALMAASGQGHLPSVKVLVQRGADLNVSPDGTALHWALSCTSWAVVDYLLAAGPDGSVQDEYGAQTLFGLMLPGDTTRAVRAMELGADPYLKTRRGISAMGWAKRDGLDEYISLFEAVEDTSSQLYRAFEQPARSATLQSPPTKSWKKLHGLLWDELVPPDGPCRTVQGELVRCIGRLTDEAYRNGNMNFDERHRSWIAFIDSTLRNGAFDADWETSVEGYCRALRHCRTIDLTGDGSPHYLLNEAVISWCLKHPVLRGR